MGKLSAPQSEGWGVVLGEGAVAPLTGTLTSAQRCRREQAVAPRSYGSSFARAPSAPHAITLQVRGLHELGPPALARLTALLA